MLSSEVYAALDSVISSINPDSFSDEAIERLSFFFPDTLLMAALDLVDRESIIKLVSPGGKSHFEVFGSTRTYTVYPCLPLVPFCPAFCTCPAFSYAVLISRSQLMCKHVLAVRLADRLSKCIERRGTKDDLLGYLVRQYGDSRPPEHDDHSVIL